MNGEAAKEKLVGDLKSLIGDAEELLKASATQAGEKFSVARQKIEQSLVEGKKSLADAEKILVKKSKEAADVADDYVRENPWGAVGIAAIFSDELVSFGGQTLTANIVTMSVFGAISMYIISMASLFKLRRTQAAMVRPYRAPAYPLFPAFALGAAVVCLLTMVYFNRLIAALFVVLGVLGYAYFAATAARRTG
jgi:ElaB/YqjD/DUF883 family membrane-anchored ribosome-binding protein